MASTLLLDQIEWDLVVDSAGNIAVATAPYAIAQDVASALRTFQGEVYYDTTLGIPYFEQILGKLPPLQLLKQVFVDAALAVPLVTGAQAFLAALVDRRLTGQVQVVDSSGTVAVVSISPGDAGGPFILGQSSLGGLDVI